MSQLSYSQVGCQISFKLETPEELLGQPPHKTTIFVKSERVEYQQFKPVYTGSWLSSLSYPRSDTAHG